MAVSTGIMRASPCYRPMAASVYPLGRTDSPLAASFLLDTTLAPHFIALHFTTPQCLTCVKRPAIWLRLASSRRDDRVSWPMKWHQCKSAVSVLLPLLFHSCPSPQQVHAPSLSRPFNHFHLCQLPFSHHTRFDVPADLHPLCVQPRSALRQAV